MIELVINIISSAIVLMLGLCAASVIVFIMIFFILSIFWGILGIIQVFRDHS